MEKKIHFKSFKAEKGKAMTFKASIVFHNQHN